MTTSRDAACWRQALADLFEPIMVLTTAVRIRIGRWLRR